MNCNDNSKILIVGLGLIGGSYARALKKKGFYIMAIDECQASIDYALSEGFIDRGSSKAEDEMISEADVVIFALYPNVFKLWIAEHQRELKPGAMLTDVTGVKACLVYEIQRWLRPDVEFIAAHPMAGREVYGVENSDDAIFKGANFIVVPTARNSEKAIEWCKELGKLLGFARISILSPEEHDEAIGFVSQLTHCIAVALMTCNDNQHLVNYTGDSFRDLTRIARINDAMWSELFLLNKPALLHQMDVFMEEFTVLREMLASEDVEGLREKMRLSTQRRACFDKQQ